MPFDTWEDWNAGMYLARLDLDMAVAARGLLCDQEAFREAATEMLREWPTAAHQNLAHMQSGRNAWVGQATCCYSLGATAAETRQAWGMMSNTDQTKANETARRVRSIWEKGDRDAQTSFAV